MSPSPIFIPRPLPVPVPRPAAAPRPGGGAGSNLPSQQGPPFQIPNDQGPVSPANGRSGGGGKPKQNPDEPEIHPPDGGGGGDDDDENTTTTIIPGAAPTGGAAPSATCRPAYVGATCTPPVPKPPSVISKGTEIGAPSSCRVAGRTHAALGFTPVANVTVAELRGLAWTEGVSASAARSSGNVTYQRSFYLGTPAALDLPASASAPGWSGCAVFFPKLDIANVDYDAADADGMVAPSLPSVQGNCDTALSAACVQAIMARARAAVASTNATGLAAQANICAKVKDAFESRMDDACSRFAEGGRWSGLIATELFGGGTAPIAGSQNVTTNCWPVVPRSNNLRLITSTETLTSTDLTSAWNNAFATTLILTLMMPKNRSTTASAAPETHLTCLKAVGNGAEFNDVRALASVSQPTTGSAKSRTPSLALMVAILLPLLSVLFGHGA